MYSEPKDTFFYSKKTCKIGKQIFDLSFPRVMGIINCTPDSFFEGSRSQSMMEIVGKAGDMLTDGADLLDLGGYSSRPGAADVTQEEEFQRVIPTVKAIKKEFPDALISVDTFRSEIARAAVGEGADMINDISGGEADRAMFQTIAELSVPYVLMHMRGNPQTMQQQTAYDNIIMELLDYFIPKINRLRDLGVNDIILDPGFGFAKTMDQNYELLKGLKMFKLLNLPVLAGVSRKSMIYKKLEIAPEEALNGTSILNSIALMNQVNFLRVHDVKEAVETVTLFKTTFN